MYKEVSLAEQHEAAKESLEKLRQTNWWIITGGPSTGKSTIINNLAERGYKVMPEAARVFIDSKFDKGRTIEQIRFDEVKFQIDVLRMKEKIEDETPENELIFWDRGLAGDSMAYLSLSRRPKGTSISIYDSGITTVVKRRYRGVFLLDQLPFYKQDYARIEDDTRSAQIHQRINLAYQMFGYEPIRVPVFPCNEAVSVNQRAQFIIDHVRRTDTKAQNLSYPFSIPIQHSFSF